MTEAEQERVRRYVARLDEKRRTLEGEIEETVALARGMTPEEHDRDSQAVVEGALGVLLARPDLEKVIHFVEPPAPDFQRIWKRLVEEGKRRKHG
jgi:hypothetical protein